MQDAKKPNAAVIAIIIVVLVGAVAAGTIYIMNSRKASDSVGMQSPPSKVPDSDSNGSIAAPPAAPARTSSYMSGTYKASGDYLSPGGQESVDIEVTLDGDIITAVTVTPHAATSTSTQYQGEFVTHCRPMIIGKDIDDVKLSRVAGSSLTSGGFNQALDKIKAEAAA